jgi:hypothetical protein
MVRPLLASLPALTVVLVALANLPRPRADSDLAEPDHTGPVAPARLAVVRAALAVGGIAVVAVEVLSTRRAIGVASLTAVWTLTLVVAGGVAAHRGWFKPLGAAVTSFPGNARTLARTIGTAWSRWTWPARLMLVTLGGLVLAELLLATLSAPNTFDSYTYHLPRIEHWAAAGSVEPYPVRIHRQVTYPPGAEYLLLHLRLLWGGDALYALLQWSAGVLCLLCVTRIVIQLGGGRRAQLLAAFVAGTAPALVLEASSTQVDLVVAAWLACLTTLVLDGVGRRPRTAPSAPAVVWLGLATGLIGVTKSPALVVATALLLWWALAWLRRDARVPTVVGVLASAGAVIALTAAMTGPYLWRTYQEFGHPLGPSYLRESISLERHDPAAILVNGLRQTHTMVDTPVRPISDLLAAGVAAASRALGLDPNDPEITFGGSGSTFPTVSWYPSEGKAAVPVTALLLAAGVIATLVRGGPRRVLAGITLLAVLSHAITVKWSPWGNRLTLYIMVLATPLAGVWLAAMFRSLSSRRGKASAVAGRRVLAAALAGCLVLSGLAGWLSAGYGWPRRLVGERSVFTVDRWQSRFVLRPGWAEDFTAVAGAVRASGARRVGVVQGNDSWEYPWWLLLEGRQLLALQSQLPNRPPADPSDVDAVVCASGPDLCRQYVPPGWKLHQHGTLSYALPQR